MITAEALTLRPRISLRWGISIATLAALIVLVRLLGLEQQQSIQMFAVVFTAIAVEALPFVLLGAIVAALLEVYVPERVYARVARLPVGLQLPAAALGGFAFPVCECGSVPVARRLIARGMHPSAGVAFMIASPIFNPIVLGSTWIAYSARGLGVEMVAGRAALGLLLALMVGWAIGAEGAHDLLRSRSDQAGDDGVDRSCCAAGVSKWRAFGAHLSADFFYMGRFLILGAGIAAALQASVPQNLVAGAASSPVFASLALMAVAFVSSLCSEADAFVAVSFTAFPLGSQLAFLVFGPVLDFKLFFMYGATFERKVVVGLAAIAIPFTLVGALWFEVVLS
jgi:uncharacterized membrane protein YraQ (UPF0718 family)